MTPRKCDCLVNTGWTTVPCGSMAKNSINVDGRAYFLCGLHLSHYNRGNRIMLRGAPKLYTVNETVYKEKLHKEQEEQERVREAREANSRRYWFEKVAQDFGLTYKEALTCLSKKAKKG